MPPAKPFGTLLVSLLTAATIASTSASAQNFKVLHDFTGGGDGAFPYAPLVLSGNTLYGAAGGGGSGGHGVVFSLNRDGTGFTNLYSFTAGAYDPLHNVTNIDGSSTVGLLLSGSTLYGTAFQGGPWDNGTLFRIETNGTGFTNLHSFTSTVSNPFNPNEDGANPTGPLILWGETLYGAASDGGTSGSGTIFAINTNGSDFRTTYDFTPLSGPSRTNSDGGLPQTSLLLLSNTLYGVALQGGIYANGTLFAAQADGTGFTNLCNFDWTNGGYPAGALVFSGNTFYGTAYHGGRWNHGTIFAVHSDGSGLRTLHEFSAFHFYGSTNEDGANPSAGLILADNTLYGTTSSGGSHGAGTVFAINIDGTGFTTLHSFTWSDGAKPYAALTLAGDTLYGAASEGGAFNYGVLFSLSIVPQLRITSIGPNVILTWPTSYAGVDFSGYTLQSTGTLPGAWTKVIPAPTNINGQFTITNFPTGLQQYYRLSRPVAN